ncbi:zinc finger, CCHC-type containing protein [Tanacetum coccineum]
MAATAIKHMALNFVKLDKFEGVDFRRWQKKMHFLLSSMSVVYVLTTPIPEDGGDDATVEQVMKRNKWDNDDYVCIELWNFLEAKYMADDASSKKFLVSNFTNYKMTDSRPVLEQYNELLGILGRFTQHKMNMDESIQVSCIIDKLPPSWKDFKHTLKHLKDELTLVELGSHLRIEESLRVQDSDKPKSNNVAGPHYLCDLNAILSFRNKKYFVTFIDDASRAVVRLLDPKLKTLGERGIECIFVGYAEHFKAFRDAIFDENIFSSVPRPSLRIPNRTEDIGGSVVPKEATKEVDLTKKFLSSRFFMKDMGEAGVILGIRIKHESNGIAISQSYYIKKVLKKFNYFDCTPVSTLIDTSEKLMPNNGQAVSQLEYSRVIGCLMYVMTCTRPNIAFDVGKLNRCKMIATSEDNSSTSGWVFLLGGGVISWASNKQTCITGLTMESEFVALGFSSVNGKSRHLGVRHSMIRELITNGVISIEFVRSQRNLADHLTKGLAIYLVLKSGEGMGLKSN